MSRTRYELASDKKLLLLDGEIGGIMWKHPKVKNGGPFKTPLVTATICIDDPDYIKKVHLDYIRAGADIITANTYATVAKRLEKELDYGDSKKVWEQMMSNALDAAVDARKESGNDRILIAGSLPPLHGSYKPLQVGAYNDIFETYKEHIKFMENKVDFFLIETMTTIEEARAAANACSTATNKPYWISWTIKDSFEVPVRLRSNENLVSAIEDVLKCQRKPDGLFVNCAKPEIMHLAIDALIKYKNEIRFIGCYGNAFENIPDNWKVKEGGIKALGRRNDVSIEFYSEAARKWLDKGANVVGGCCQIGVEYIAELAKIIEKRE